MRYFFLISCIFLISVSTIYPSAKSSKISKLKQKIRRPSFLKRKKTSDIPTRKTIELEVEEKISPQKVSKEDEEKISLTRPSRKAPVPDLEKVKFEKIRLKDETEQKRLKLISSLESERETLRGIRNINKRRILSRKIEMLKYVDSDQFGKNLKRFTSSLNSAKSIERERENADKYFPSTELSGRKAIFEKALEQRLYKIGKDISEDDSGKMSKKKKIAAAAGLGGLGFGAISFAGAGFSSAPLAAGAATGLGVAAASSISGSSQRAISEEASSGDLNLDQEKMEDQEFLGHDEEGDVAADYAYVDEGAAEDDEGAAEDDEVAAEDDEGAAEDDEVAAEDDYDYTGDEGEGTLYGDGSIDEKESMDDVDKDVGRSSDGGEEMVKVSEEEPDEGGRGSVDDEQDLLEAPMAENARNSNYFVGHDKSEKDEIIDEYLF